KLEICTVFSVPNFLTSVDELLRGQVPERAVGTILVVVESPGFDLLPSVGQRGELLDVQAFVAQTTVEAFDECVFHGLPGVNEIELYAAPISPILESSRCELGTVVHRDRSRRDVCASYHSVQHVGYHLSAHRRGDLQDRTLATPLIDDGEHPKSATISKSVVN